jgi:DNA-binding XRE family transcriptional regulator
MPSEIFYYRDASGACPVQDFLDRLTHKDLARCLSQIDLLETDELPQEIDQEILDTPLRVLTVRTGRTRYRFTYLRHGNQAVLIDANQNKLSKMLRADKDVIQEAMGSLCEEHRPAPDRLKSHRETVAERTLSDPTLAALYARARENAQFALSLIRLRTSAGFTVDTLAERTGLSKRRVESLERGRMPKLSTMRRLVDALQARIIISPGGGLLIEPCAEPRRASRRRSATLEMPGEHVA